MSALPVKTFRADDSGSFRLSLILNIVRPVLPSALLNLVGTSSMKSITQKVIFTNSLCFFSEQLKYRLFSSLGIFKKSREPSSSLTFSMFQIRLLLIVDFARGHKAPVSSDYGIKQSREPKFAAVDEGASVEHEQARPARAPSDA